MNTGKAKGIFAANAAEIPFLPYAYIWTIGAIKEDRPVYKEFLWDVILLVKMLRKLGSTDDFFLYVYLSMYSQLDELPADNLWLVNVLGINITQSPKPKTESFGQIVYKNSPLSK